MEQVNFNSYNALNQYTDQLGIKKDLSGDDLKEIVSSLDKDENGNVSLDTFSKAVADKYNKRVDENNEDLDYLIQLFASADGDASTISESDLEIFASTEEDINKNVNELILEEIESTINQRLEEIQADANSKTGFGKLWNGISGAFGGGTKAQENEIKELQELYEHALKHPTKSNLNTLYKKVYGERLNYDEIKMSYQTALNVQNGVYQTADGNVLTLQDVGQAMSEQVNQLAQSFDETVDSQGWLSKGFSWLNNNLLGIGQTENMTTAQIKELQNLAGKLASTKDPLEFAGIFKQLTGEELTEDSLSSLLSGVSMVENTRASEAMMDYETTQEVAITTVAAVATGIATATMGPLGGAAVGAAINVGVHGLDAATRNNGKGVMGNLADYATNDLIKDAAVGALNGFSNVVGNKAGAFVKGFLPETTGAAKVGIRLASEFIEGGADGAISNAGEYMVDVMAGDAQFSAGELLTRTSLGFGMGGVMSVGMQEGMSLIGGGVAFLKGTDADGAVKGATDGVQEGLEKGAADGVEDGLEKGAADGVEDGLEKGAADGIEDGLEKGAADGVEDGLEKGAADGVQSSKPTYSKPELDKYKIHEASEILNEQQFKINYAQANNYQISSDGAWAYYNTSSQHSAWKMHVFADSVDDLDNLDPVLKYLRDNNINHKFTGPNQDFAYQTSGIQSGKGITIYPTDVAQMEQLAKDLDYIIKNNDLCRPNTKIHGDNMMGDSGRLFYRYEFQSGSQANDILDLNNPADNYNYHNNYYKANDATGNYLAPDMNPATDDPWLNFDPSDPASKFGQGPKASGTTSVDGATSTTAHGVQDGAQKGAADATRAVDVDALARNYDMDITTAQKVSEVYSKIQSQLQVTSVKEVESLVQDIMSTGATREEAMAALSYMTQFGNVQSLEHAFDNIGINSFYKTGDNGVDANCALQYFCGKKGQINLSGGKTGFILDDYGLRYIEKHGIPSDVVFINMPGIDNGINIFTQGMDNAAISQNAANIIAKAREFQAQGLSLNEAFEQAISADTLERAAALGIDVSKIKTVSTSNFNLSNITTEKIANSLNPLNVTPEKLADIVDTLSETAFPGDPASALKAKKLLAQYFDSQLDVYSPKRLGSMMKNIHERINDSLSLWTKSDGSAFTMDDVYYLIPTCPAKGGNIKSYSYVYYQYAKINGIDPSHIIVGDTTYIPSLGGDKIFVAFDDVVGSGASMLSQYDGYKYENIAGNLGNNQHVIMAPIISGSTGAEAIDNAITAANRKGSDLLLLDKSSQISTSLKTSDFYTSLSQEDKNLLDQLINAYGSKGLDGESAYAILFPYMGPDNDADITSLLFSDLILDKGALKSKAYTDEADEAIRRLKLHAQQNTTT